jgi:quercetin dioxygenase-like cupin family protein
MHVGNVDDSFSMGIFLYKQGAELPLHDHPEMSVYTRCAALIQAMRSFCRD